MSEIIKQPIHFSNNHSALAVLPTANNKIEQVIEALGIAAHKAVILVIGGADTLDETLTPRLTQLYGRGIAKAAKEVKALILDGGTDAGVMALMGQGVAAHGNQSTLIGVAPAAIVSYPDSPFKNGTELEPNHSHFVLVEGDKWGSETAMLFNLLNELTVKPLEPVDPSLKATIGKEMLPVKIPAVAILAAGGAVSKAEALRIVRKNLPLIVIEDSGGLADEIAAAYKAKDIAIDDPVMAEIIADGELHFHSLNNSVKGIERLIIRELESDKVLLQAWETFSNYDQNANLQQARFDRLQRATIFTGVLGVALVIIQQVFAPRKVDGSGDLLPADFKTVGFIWWSVYHLLIIVPIILTILVTAANRFKQGNKWLLLRAGAESIKREIYRYRTSAMQYVNNGQQHLSKMVEEITRRTMRTEVNLAALVPYDKEKGFPPYMDAAQGGDDGFSCLSPDRYVELRLGDQLSYFQRKAPMLEKQLRILYWMTFIVGGVGTYMAAIGLQAWVALTTSIVAAFGTYLGYRQTESTLTKYNQAATDLANVKAWWNALAAEEQAQQININSLVEHTEQVLQSELDGWIQQMQNALADLRKGQELPNEQEENKTPEAKDMQRRAVEKKTAIENGKPTVPDAVAKASTEPIGENNTKVISESETAIKPVGQFE